MNRVISLYAVIRSTALLYVIFQGGGGGGFKALSVSRREKLEAERNG